MKTRFGFSTPRRHFLFHQLQTVIGRLHETKEVKQISAHYRGAVMIANDAQLHQAQADIQKLWRFLESARRTHSSVDYERLAAPYLLQIQERQQEVLVYLSAHPTTADV